MIAISFDYGRPLTLLRLGEYDPYQVAHRQVGEPLRSEGWLAVYAAVV